MKKLALLALAVHTSVWAAVPVDPGPLYSNLNTPGTCHFGKCFDLETVTTQAGKVSFESQNGLLDLFKARNEAIRRKMVLLPHFNIRTFEIGIPSPIDYFPNLFPFLFPSHWYRKGASKLEAKAQEYSYISTVANQRSTAQGLYLTAHQEMMSQKILENHIAFAEKLLADVNARVAAGQVPAQDAEELMAFLSKLKSDYVMISTAITDANLDIAYLLANVSVDSNPGPVEISLPDLSQGAKTDFKQLKKIAMEVSPEIKTFDYLIAASFYSKKATFWDFLTPDMAHADVGFGFQKPAQMRIANADREQIVVQKKDFETDTVRSIKHTEQQVDSASKIYQYASSIEKSIHSVLSTLLTNLDTSSSLDVNRVISLLRDNLAAQQMKNSAAHSFLQAEGITKRLVLDSRMYGNIVKEIPTDWVNLKCYVRKENRAIRRDLETGELKVPDTIEFAPGETKNCIRI